MTKLVILVAASNGVTDAKDAADWGGQSHGAPATAVTAVSAAGLVLLHGIVAGGVCSSA
jgi:hypothetical protein